MPRHVRNLKPANGRPELRKLMILPEIGPVDGRTRRALKYREMAEQMAADRGGKDMLTRGELSLVRRAAGLEVLADLIEEGLVNGREIDIGDYCNIVNRQCRVLTALGLERKPRPVNFEVMSP